MFSIKIHSFSIPIWFPQQIFTCITREEQKHCFYSGRNGACLDVVPFFTDYDDYLDDDDLDLIEENLGVKVKRRVRIVSRHYYL